MNISKLTQEEQDELQTKGSEAIRKLINVLQRTEAFGIASDLKNLGVLHNYNSQIEQSGHHIRNKNVDSFLFTNEKEALFAEALIDYAPEGADPDKIMTVMSLINNILGVESEWTFKVKK